MDRSYMLNDYVADNEKNIKLKDEASEYLETLKFRINGSKSLNEVMIQVSKFLDMNDVPTELRDGIINICNQFTENTTIYTAQKELEEYLGRYLDDAQKDYEKTNDTVNEIKEELIEDANRKLDEVNVSLTGDSSEIMDNIKDEDDVYRIKNNIDNTYEYFQERNNLLNEEKVSNIEVDLNTVNDVVESSNDNIILNEALEIQDNMLESNNSNFFEAKEDGSIEITGDVMNKASVNFAAMMTTMLVASDRKLDMKFIKNREEISKFRIIYGNFPLVNHPENKLDSAIISEIAEKANSYNHNTDYMDVLSKASPEIKETLEIVNNNAFGRKGAFQMAINNANSRHEVLFAMDNNYNDILNAFNDNGATVERDTEDHGIVLINDDMPGNQLLILTNTNEDLAKEKELINDPVLKKNNQLVKKIDMNQAARVSHILLSTIAIAEILFGITYFIVLLFF